MSLGPGSTIGPFKIQSLIGKGGMGEVFSAVDTRLDRKVALKLLPDDFGADAQRLHRFQSEAKTLASLNHPNILVIHEVGAEKANPYLVSELLEGETLREKLNADAIPQRKAIEYALQIAQGLAAAHAKGIVHRDLKPENIFITKDGRLKILDFGLAKFTPSPNSQLSAHNSQLAGDQPTLLEKTTPGLILGTVGYMSPEQVRGETINHRSDIFSFGVILYEMLTEKNPFRRDTAAETMTAILKEEPADLNPAIFSNALALERVIRRCLEKHADQRFQSASDLAFALEAVTASTTSASPVGAPGLQTPAKSPSLWKLTAAALAILLMTAGYLTWKNHTGAPFTATTPSPKWRGERLGGPETSFLEALSPDGKELAFTSMQNGLTQLGVMMIESGDWNMLTTNRDRGFVGKVCWSVTGTDIYFDRKRPVIPIGSAGGC